MLRGQGQGLELRGQGPQMCPRGRPQGEGRPRGLPTTSVQ